MRKKKMVFLSLAVAAVGLLPTMAFAGHEGGCGGGSRPREYSSDNYYSRPPVVYYAPRPRPRPVIVIETHGHGHHVQSHHVQVVEHHSPNSHGGHHGGGHGQHNVHHGHH